MINKLDSVFSALSDSTRCAVVARVIQGAAPVSELYAPYDMALSSFLRKIRVLEDAALVRTESKGRFRMVHIEANAQIKSQVWLQEQRAIWKARFDRFDALVMSLDTGHHVYDARKDKTNEP